MTTLQTLTIFSLATVLLHCGADTSYITTQTVQADTTTTYATTTANLKSRFIPDKVFQMTNLRHLTIQGMDCDYGDTTTCWMIREIPKQIANLKKLETLQLNVNAIRTVPQEISALQNLKSLDLTDNPGLSDIDNITTLTNLETLGLFGCGLAKLPANIGQLKKLKYLRLNAGGRLNTCKSSGDEVLAPYLSG